MRPAVIPKWDNHINSSPPGLGIYAEEEAERLWEPEVGDSRKEHVKDTPGLIHIFTGRDCDHKHKTYIHQSQTKA